MADKNEVRKSKKEVLDEIRLRIRENPDVGVHEFVGQMLQARGIDVDINNPKGISAKVKSLKGKEKKEIVIALEEYKKEYELAIKEMEKGNMKNIIKLPAKLLAIMTKGIAIGMSGAGIVNTIAPGLFNTMLGYLAGAGVELHELVRLGLVTTGIFAPPAFSQGAILALGGIIGGVTYTSGKLVVNGVKALVNKGKEAKYNKRYGIEK